MDIKSLVSILILMLAVATCVTFLIHSSRLLDRSGPTLAHIVSWLHVQIFLQSKNVYSSNEEIVLSWPNWCIIPVSIKYVWRDSFRKMFSAASVGVATRRNDTEKGIDQ